MKKIQIILMCITVVCVLAGCNTKSDSGNPATQSDAVKTGQNQSTDQFPTQYSAEDKNVTFSCEVLAPESPVLTVSTAKKAKVKCLELGEKMIADETIVQSTVWDSDGTDTVYDGKREITEQEIADNVEVMYSFGEQSLVNIGRNSLYLFKDWNSVTDVLNLGQEDEGYNGDLYKNNKSFDFCSKEKIVEDLEELVHLYTNVENTIETVYCVDSELLNKCKDPDKQKDLFTKDADGYYICMRQELQGIPVQGCDVDNYTEYAGNAPIIAYYTESGWRELIIDGTMLYEFKTTGTEIKLAQFEDVVKTVSDYYNSMITENTYEVYRATLYNFVKKNGEVIPVWIFKTYERYPDGYFRCDQLDINAVTGEVFTVYD